MRRTSDIGDRGRRYVLQIAHDNAPPALFVGDGDGAPSEVFGRMLEAHGLPADRAVSFRREGPARRAGTQDPSWDELIGEVRDMPQIGGGAMVMLRVIFRDGPFVIPAGRSLSPEADRHARELIRAGLVTRDGDVWSTTALGDAYPLDLGAGLIRDHGEFPLFEDADQAPGMGG